MDNVVSVKDDSTGKTDVDATMENGESKSLETKKNNIDNTITKTSENSDATAIVEDSQNKYIEQVDFKVIFNKTKHDIVFGWDNTVKDLKAHLEKIIGVPQNAQKLIIKGMARDEVSLRKAGVVKGGKVMLVGSKIDDILSVTSTPQQVQLEERAASHSSKEPLSVQKIHQKVLDKGVPPDAMPAIKDIKESLPPVPLSGMLNKHGGKVRLTFKPEQEQLWLGTKERTEKLAMTSIKNIVSEPIKDHEEYHIMGLQLGPTEASRYWVYWVPAQYVEAIKDAILGKWQFF